MATTGPPNPLLSSHQPSDVQVILHPLVLLTISDYITRHNLREMPGFIVGGLLGLHRGRDITIEHAFDCATVPGVDAAEKSMIDIEQFVKRLEQFKTVHKDRKLDLVGWYTILPKAGPSPSILPTHLDILEQNDSALLLAFHPDEATHQSAGAKLPLSIYESNYEVDDGAKAEGDGAAGKAPAGSGRAAPEDEDKKMEDGDSALKLKFRELPYTVEAEESEMISMDFVAKGGGNATAIETKVAAKPGANSTSASATGGASTGSAAVSSSKPTKRTKPGAVGAGAGDTDMEAKSAELVLSREEEEMISSLTAKANAVRMLQSRINLITKYLEQLPDVKTEMTDADAPAAGPSHVILRQIQALVTRLNLVVPSDVASFEAELARERNDVDLVTVLNNVVQSTISAREVLRKSLIVESAKRQSSKQHFIPQTSFAEDARYDSLPSGLL